MSALSSKKHIPTDRKCPRAETDSRGSDLPASSSAPPQASTPTIISPSRPRVKRPKTVKPSKEPATPKTALPVLAAGPVKGKGKGKGKGMASGISARQPEYIASSESDGEDGVDIKAKQSAQYKGSPTSSGSEHEDLTASLHARTKAAAIMAGIAVPPGSHRDRFKKRYAEFTAEKTLGASHEYW